MCRYRRESTNEFPFIKPDRKGEHHTFCEPCMCDVSICSGGCDDMTRRIKSTKYVDAVRANATMMKDKPISKFFPSTEYKSVIQSEVMFTKFLIDNNLPIAVSDKFNKLVSSLFLDSDIAAAKKYQCGCTKATAIANALASDCMDKLADLLKEIVFSLSTDGFNKSDMKLYPIVIQHYDKSEGLKSGSTAQNIKDLIVMQLNKFNIPYSNCVGFSADNCIVT